MPSSATAPLTAVPAEQSAARDGRALRRLPKSALLVVADSSLRNVLSIALRLDGIAVQTTDDVRTARTLRRDAQPEVVLVDAAATSMLDAALTEETAVLVMTPPREGPALPDDPRIRTLMMPFDRAGLRRALVASAAMPERRVA